MAGVCAIDLMALAADPASFGGTILALLLLVLAVMLSLFVAGLGIKREIRRSRLWRIGLGSIVAITVILVPVAFYPTWHARHLMEQYSFYPKAPMVLDGMLFPAGSAVYESEDPPHHVKSGSVPISTVVLGLPIVGDFNIEYSDGPEAKPFLPGGELTGPADIGGVPCGPGGFEYSVDAKGEEETECTLAHDLPVAHLAGWQGTVTLKGGTQATISHTQEMVARTGTLATEWKGPMAECGPGGFGVSEKSFACTLAHDQVFEGYPLAGGQSASFKLQDDGKVHVESGVLSRGLAVAEIRVPAGSSLLSAHNVVPDEDALPAGGGENTVFQLPAQARLVVGGAEMRGEVILEIFPEAIKVLTVGDSDSASIHHEGTVSRLGLLDRKTHSWCWDDGCKKQDHE
jgi:hypothetical protein